MVFQQHRAESYTFRMTHMTLQSLSRTGISVLLLLCSVAAALPGAHAKALYSYTDDRGTRIITDNYHNIPPVYRAKVTTVEQETEGAVSDSERVSNLVGSVKGFVVPVPGMSLQQSKIITYAGSFALLCLLAMTLSRSEAVRALALWCLVLTAICAPVLIYAADDGAAAIMKNKAAEIEQKQQDRLSHAQ
jgi:hypothetical protein